jgi:ATP synthase subunit 6
LFKQQVNTKNSFKFFAFYFTIFAFVLSANLLGLMPYCFTLTAQIFLNFLLAFSVVLGLSIFGFIYHSYHFVKFFIPSGVPSFLIPILFIIELISYCIRPLSLSARLFANLLSGHTLLHILSNFGLYLFKKFPVIFILPFVFIFFIIILEFCIAFIQAYVFILLSLIYLNDIYNLNH